MWGLLGEGLGFGGLRFRIPLGGSKSLRVRIVLNALNAINPKLRISFESTLSWSPCDSLLQVRYPITP